MSKKIYRSKTNRMISGVCGGLGEYFSIDPTIIRLFWLLLAISTSGGGIIAYIIAIIIMPEEDDNMTYYDGNNNKDTFKNSAVFLGVGLIIVGSILLAKKIWPWFSLKWFRFSKYWPIILIIAGIYVIYKQKNHK